MLNDLPVFCRFFLILRTMDQTPVAINTTPQRAPMAIPAMAPGDMAELGADVDLGEDEADAPGADVFTCTVSDPIGFQVDFQVSIQSSVEGTTNLSDACIAVATTSGADGVLGPGAWAMNHVPWPSVCQFTPMKAACANALPRFGPLVSESGEKGRYAVGCDTAGGVRVRFSRAKGTLMVMFWEMLPFNLNVKPRKEGLVTIVVYCGLDVFHR